MEEKTTEMKVLTPEEQEVQLARVEGILREFVEEGSDFTLDLKEWKFQIRIKGPKWNGVVDKPIADFVIDLDKKLRAELAKHGVEIPASEHGLVALRVGEGSTLAFLENVPETLEAIRKFPQEQQMLIFISILIVSGVWGSVKIMETLTKRIETKEETEKEKIRSQERVEIIRALTEKDSRRELEQPLRSLMGKLDDKKDTIQLPATPTPLKKEEAKEALEKAARRRHERDRPHRSGDPRRAEGGPLRLADEGGHPARRERLPDAEEPSIGAGPLQRRRQTKGQRGLPEPRRAFRSITSWRSSATAC